RPSPTRQTSSRRKQRDRELERELHPRRRDEGQVEEEENEEAQEEAPKDEAEIQVGASGGRREMSAALWLRLVGIITLMCFAVDAGVVNLLGF
ncbi:unnamed protein product, partial [Urochloa humidicola]